MKAIYELDENDIHKAISAYVASDVFRVKQVKIDVSPVYGTGTEDGTVIGHSVSAMVEGERIKETK